jgi:hypothetical protein
MSKQTDKRIDDKIETNNYINDLNGVIKCLKSELADVKAESERRRLAIQELLLQSLSNGKKIESLETQLKNLDTYYQKQIKRMKKYIIQRGCYP